MEKRLKVRYSLITGVLALGVGGYFYVNSLIETNMEDIELTQEVIAQNSNEKADFNLENIKPVSEKEILENNADRRLGLSNDEHTVGMKGIIGGLYVPSVDMKLPIFKGIGQKSLSRGSGTAFEDRNMGEGNFVLLGHNSPNKYVLFSPLERMNTGDLIYTTDATWVYEYETTEKKRIHQSQGEVMNNSDQNMITLITCFGGLNTDKRTVITGKLKHKYPVSEAEKEVKEQLNLKD